MGTTKTDLDTLTLRETVVNSTADVLSPEAKHAHIHQIVTDAGPSPPHRPGVLPRRTRKALWNGLKLNSPTLGMVDFSMIPSFFTIDRGSLTTGPARRVSRAEDSAVPSRSTRNRHRDSTA
ncbi:MAG: hypothetical protein ACLR8Y_01760 [Alistipes indistinctus]